jgi:lysyl-tRNA synthetase class 1
VFATKVAASKTADEVQAAAFDAIKVSGAEPSRFFSAVYRVLVGADRGPRLGPYAMDAGVTVIAQKITDALNAAKYN